MRNWRKFTWFILVVNILFLIWIISIGVDAAGTPDECKDSVEFELEICKELYDLGSGIATTLIVFLWAAADVILGIVWLVTNRSGKRDAPLSKNADQVRHIQNVLLLRERY